MAKIVPVILAGGSGSRLWPVSRDAFPKQFQPLVGPLSTYQQTLNRVSDPALFADPVVITSEEFRFFARRQAQDVGIQVSVVLEPMRRDSAAAMAAAAAFVEATHPGAMMLALAADHIVLDDNVFRKAVRCGVPAAEDNKVVVFGLVPTEPKTAYGYIRPGAKLGEDPDLCAVEKFVEKPDFETAIGYCRDGYLWNSGNFLVRASALLAEFETHAADIGEAAKAAVSHASTDIGFVRLSASHFGAARKTSIDYALIEKTSRIAVVRGHFRWSDIGAWDAIWQIGNKDDDENTVVGNAMALDSRGCLVQAEGVFTAVVGADNLLVVSTPDAVLVVPRDKAQSVKTLVDKAKAAGHGEISTSRRDYRPWGFVESVDGGERFAVKRIVVDPGGVLSLQRHQHRAEHWVVVHGTATVTLDGEADRILTENESLYVAVGTVHRLANRGRIPLEIIEVQTGSYLGEDDIIRLDDVYRRR